MKNLLIALALIFVFQIGYSQNKTWIDFECFNCEVRKDLNPKTKYNGDLYTGLRIYNAQTGTTIDWIDYPFQRFQDFGTYLIFNEDPNYSYSYGRIRGADNFMDFVTNKMDCLKGAGAVTDHMHESYDTFAEPTTSTESGTDDFGNDYDAGATIINFPDGNGGTLSLCVQKPGDTVGDFYIAPDSIIIDTPQPPDGSNTVWYDTIKTFHVHEDSNGNLDSIEVTKCIPQFPPFAVNDIDSTEIDTPVTFDVTGNDSGTDSPVDDSLIDYKFGTTGTSGGTIVDNGDGTATYTPPPGEYGILDSIPYCVYDAEGDKSNIAYNIIYIPCPDAKPVNFSIAGRGEAPNSTDNIDLICDASKLSFTPECFEICFEMRDGKTHFPMGEQECITCDWDDPTNVIAHDFYSGMGLSKPDGTPLDANNFSFSGGIFTMVGVSKNDPDAYFNLEGWEHPNPDLNGYVLVDAKFMGCEDCDEVTTYSDTIHTSSWIETVATIPNDSNTSCPNNSTGWNVNEIPPYSNPAFCDDDDELHLFLPNGSYSNLYTDATGLDCNQVSGFTTRGCIDNHPCINGLPEYCGDNQGVQDLMTLTTTIHYANSVNGNALNLPVKMESYRDWVGRGHFAGTRFRGGTTTDNEACTTQLRIERRNSTNASRCTSNRNSVLKLNGNIYLELPDESYCSPVNGGNQFIDFADEDLPYCEVNLFEWTSTVWVDTDNDGVESSGDKQFNGYAMAYIFKNRR